MRKKINYLLAILISSTTLAYSQADHRTIKLNKAKPVPCDSTLAYKPGVIDSISYRDFKLLVNNINEKIKKTESLSKDDDRVIIMLMNTLVFSTLDKQENNVSKLKEIDNINFFFEKKYHGVLKQKYKICLGRGFSDYYTGIDIQYMGNPFSCSRFFIQ